MITPVLLCIVQRLNAEERNHTFSCPAGSYRGAVIRRTPADNRPLDSRSTSTLADIGDALYRAEQGPKYQVTT